MTAIAIKARGLGKEYRLGERLKYKTLRDTVANAFRASRSAPAGRSKSRKRSQTAAKTIWALKDVSFDVRHGDVVGIIGGNGAGKSTLLKILSRITEPTVGYVDIRGRIGSLLEVGTGFHPELTGRENVFLNGSIMGMRRREVLRNFDEIVAFAEVEDFIDTQVKYYSTGMSLRLAFSVAAHLEPEILLIDEVLAVGDAQFQTKCLRKMGTAASSGRTIVFVSHNMQAVQSLCTRALLIEQGVITASGETSAVVKQYLAGVRGIMPAAVWSGDDAPGDADIRLRAIRISQQGDAQGIFASNQPVDIEITFVAQAVRASLCIGFDLMTAEGVVLLRSYQTDLAPADWPDVRIGVNTWKCRIPPGLLNAGSYYVSPRIGVHNKYWTVFIDAVAQFKVVLNHGISPLWNSLDQYSRPGVAAPIFDWEVLPPQHVED